MKYFLLSLLLLLANGSSALAQSTDFTFSCAWLINGKVESSVQVEKFGYMTNGFIKVHLPGTRERKTTYAYFRFHEGTVDVEIQDTEFTAISNDGTKEIKPEPLFDGTVNFTMGTETKVFATKSGDEESSFQFTLTPPEGWKPDTKGTKLTEAEIGKLDYSTRISGGDAFIAMHNGNPFEVSHALIRIRGKATDTEDPVDRVYSVKLNIPAHKDSFDKINSSISLSGQEYEITLEEVFR